MESLYARFEACRSRIRPGSAIRFAIGGAEPIYLGDHRKPNGAYIENAVDRALTLYGALPAAPDLLRIDDCPDLSLPGLPPPEECRGGSCFWALSPRPPFLTKLLREIIRAELDSAGLEDLTDHVCFLNTEQCLLFRPIDDRFADAAAADPEVLRPLTDAFRDWLSD